MANDKKRDRLIRIPNKTQQQDDTADSLEISGEELYEKIRKQAMKTTEEYEAAVRLGLYDDYNRIHNYRRKDDKIVFYYNTKTNERAIIAVKQGDDLAKSPFFFEERFIVTEQILNQELITRNKGMVSITEENMETLQKLGILTDETAYVIYFNRKNVGFYL